MHTVKCSQSKLDPEISGREKIEGYGGATGVYESWLKSNETCVYVCLVLCDATHVPFPCGSLGSDRRPPFHSTLKGFGYGQIEREWPRTRILNEGYRPH